MYVNTFLNAPTTMCYITFNIANANSEFTSNNMLSSLKVQWYVLSSKYYNSMHSYKFFLESLRRLHAGNLFLDFAAVSVLGFLCLTKKRSKKKIQNANIVEGACLQKIVRRDEQRRHSIPITSRSHSLYSCKFITCLCIT